MYKPALPPTAIPREPIQAQLNRALSTRIRASQRPVAKSQIRIVPSLLAMASEVLSGAIATACAPARGLKAAFWVQLAVSQIRTVP